MKKLYHAAIAAILAVGFTSCGLNKVIVTPVTVPLICSATPENRCSDLDRGLSLTVTSDVTNNDIYDASELGYNQETTDKIKNSMTFYPTIKEFVTESMSTFIRSSGIALGRDLDNDYRLNIRVREFKLIAGRNSARAVVVLDYSLINTDNEVLIQNTARGRAIISGETNVGQKVLDRAYSKAIKDMDWVGIAGALTVHRRAEQEPQRQVAGDGNTALEQTVIRWYIVSSPAGADVSWRVISSTPDVKNTNSSYVGTTPYETTESFDIRGLKFENSGNVQIEVTCEKPGYLPQRRRFNLRQAIEQREISAKFNLIKEE